jgi:hypothetical protein
MARTKGSKNKVGASAKENILAVFTRLGGTSAMAEWAKNNQTEFYRLYGRLIPQEVTGKMDHKHEVSVGDATVLGQRLSETLQRPTRTRAQ